MENKPPLHQTLPGADKANAYFEQFTRLYMAGAINPQVGSLMDWFPYSEIVIFNIKDYKFSVKIAPETELTTMNFLSYANPITGQLIGAFSSKTNLDIYNGLADDNVASSSEEVVSAKQQFTGGESASEALSTYIKNTVNESVIRYFRVAKSILDSVYLVRTQTSRLSYLIVLKEDTDGNRSNIFEILDEPMIDRMSSHCSVRFRFLPQTLKDKIVDADLIELQ